MPKKNREIFVDHPICLWMNSTKSQTSIILDNFLKKQAITKLLLAYKFRKMFQIGKNSKLIHIAYSFDEILIFFWLTLVYIFCLTFDFSLHHRFTFPKETNNEIKTKQNTVSLVWDTDSEKVIQREIYLTLQHLLLIKWSHTP